LSHAGPHDLSESVGGDVGFEVDPRVGAVLQSSTCRNDEFGAVVLALDRRPTRRRCRSDTAQVDQLPSVAVRGWIILAIIGLN
jgi:hypothetical protein